MLKEVADELKLTPGAVSQTVDILVRENIVERTISPADRRAILLRPTEAGLKLKQQHSDQINNIMNSISSGVAPQDFKVFARVLAELLKQISNLPDQLR